MTLLDWFIVFLLNGAVIVYALKLGRGTKTSGDWFLAGKTLPFWIVGLSLYATLIDSADLIADTGGAYSLGVRLFVPNLVGVIGGWFLLAHFIAIPMYRKGMYTNAEFLEARFGVGARVISVLVQVLYRTVMIGMISTAIFLLLHVVCAWGVVQAWGGVIAVALLATVYTMSGGLRSVAITDAIQGIVILVAAITIFGAVSVKVGGWGGLEAAIAEKDPVLARQMMHIGADFIETVDASGLSPEVIERELRIGGHYDEDVQVLTRVTPAWLIVLSFTIVGFAYSIVNHTQSMRLLGSRSEWDMKMAIVPAGLLLIVMTFLSLGLGVMGRGLYPDVGMLPDGRADNVFPHILQQFGSPGLTGLVVAGVFAAAFSTYDSIGSTLSSLITRDLYGRLLVRDRDDSHYLRVARWMTPVIIFGSFIYVPALLLEGMIFTYLKVVGAFVVPLLTVYLLGTFTRVNRSSALPGLLLGVSFGVLALLAPGLAVRSDIWLLPPFAINSYATAPLGCLVTAVTMVLVTMVMGRTPRDQCFLDPQISDAWLYRSQQEIALPTVSTPRGSWIEGVIPTVLGLVVWGLGLALTFLVFW
jgi:solute:Na+ symporter, SSS family